MMLIEGIFLKHSPDFEQPSRTLDNNSIDIYQHVTVYVNHAVLMVSLWLLKHLSSQVT